MTAATDFQRILLIRRKALGDALVTMPAVLEVARAWPRARIDLVIDRPFADLCQDLVPEVNVVAWPPPGGSWWPALLRRGHYDLVIDWLANPRTALWTAVTGAPVRVGYDLPRRRWAYNIKVPRNRDGRHDLRGFAGEAFLDPLRSLGLAPAPWSDGFAVARRPELSGSLLSDELQGWVDRWLARPGSPVVVVMSATWPAKMWPAAKVADLIARLPAVGANPVLVTGPGDDWLLDAMPGHQRQDLVAPRTGLAELARLLARAELFVGTDCGPRHLAAALGLPTVTIFGPTDPGGWNPPSPRHAAVSHDVPCAPCNLTVCPVAGHPCLAELESGTVVETVARVLATIRKGSSDATAR